MTERKIRPLTPRQREVLEFITDQIRLNGRPPTMREIGSNFGFASTNATRCVLDALEKKKAIRRQPFLSRAIELPHPPAAIDDVVRVPIVGRIAAGQPLLAVENLEGELLLDRHLMRTPDGFALRVKGQSMTGAGIHDGDIVLARPDLPLQPGSIVVAIIGDEATVKRYYPGKKRIRLEPENPSFDPIIVDENTPGFRIAGRVVGLYRNY